MMSSHHPWPHGSPVPSERPVPPENPELWRRYQTIIDDARFSHFTRIPERIIRFLESFHVDFDRDTVHKRLLAHYLFIAVVDDAIDSGQEAVAETVFDCLSSVECGVNDLSRASNVAIVTEILKCHVEADNRLPMLRALQRAHREVIRERTAPSIGVYLKHRMTLGRATANQSYLLIQSALSEPNQNLCRLMEEIGAAGCLIDSVIDIGEDDRSGLLNFDLTLVNYGKLCFSAGIAGLRVLAKTPSLVFLLAEAVIDNVRDRGRSQPCANPQAASSRQSTAQSFPDSVAHPL